MSEQTTQATEKLYYDPISVAQRTQQHLFFVRLADKPAMLAYILKNSDDLHAVVITKTKREADTLAKSLNEQGVKTAALHGSKRKQENETSTAAFNEGALSVLITTDMILQSLTLSNITHLINYDLPSEAAFYLERVAILREEGESLVFVSEDQELMLLDIERVMRQSIPEAELKGFVPTPETETPVQPLKDKKKKPRHRKQKRKSANKTDETQERERD